MGNVQLPGLPTGKEDPKQLAEMVAKLLKELEWLLSGALDYKNIRAKGIVADRIDVKQLSALSADLGHITAGLIEAVTIIGAIIKTATTGQRIEMSGNSLQTYDTADRLNGPVWGTVTGSTFGDMVFYDKGIPLLEIRDDVNFFTIWPTLAAIQMRLGRTGKQTRAAGSWLVEDGFNTLASTTFQVRNGTAFDTVSQADSTATTVPGLLADFNALLAKLRSMNILA